MSNRLKPNFTAVPNVIFEKIMRTLAPGAVKVLFAICRYTYGHVGKADGDRISLKRLQDMTGMARGSVARSLKELRTLVTIRPGDPRRQIASFYRLNIEIPDAELVSLCDQGLVSKRDQVLVSLSDQASRIKRPSKESILLKKEEYAASNKRSQHSRKETDSRVNALITAFGDKYLARVGTRYAVVKGKDPALLKGLLTAGQDVPAIEAAMDSYFANAFYSKTGFDVGVFTKAFNRLNSAGTKQPHDYDAGAFLDLH